MLLQWRNLVERYSPSRPLPIVHQVILMQVVPVKDVPQGSPREPTFDQPNLDPHGDFMLGVPRVKVRGIVVAVVLRDHDPEKAADLRNALMILRSSSA